MAVGPLDGNWTLLRVLGVGGSSSVYEAVHEGGTRVAIKVFRGDRELTSFTHAQAQRESKLTRAIDDAGVVRVFHDGVSDDGSPYIVMELVEGETLEDRRRRCGGRIPVAEALPILVQLLESLTAIHDQGIVHRDIKPDNVIVTSSGRPKIVDFGLAHRGPGKRGQGWFGTPGFMAPEQARAHWNLVDERTDLWAVAATIVTVVAGRLLHEGETPSELVRAATRDEVRFDPADGTLPIPLADVLLRALAFDREDRWPTARAMLRAVRAGAAAADSGPRPRPTPRRAA
jgi:serine/threonine-protein kinase